MPVAVPGMLQLSLGALVLTWAAALARVIREWRAVPARETR